MPAAHGTKKREETLKEVVAGPNYPVRYWREWNWRATAISQEVLRPIALCPRVANSSTYSVINMKVCLFQDLESAWTNKNGSQCFPRRRAKLQLHWRLPIKFSCRTYTASCLYVFKENASEWQILHPHLSSQSRAKNDDNSLANVIWYYILKCYHFLRIKQRGKEEV